MRTACAALVLLAIAGAKQATAQNIDYALRTTAAFEVDRRRDAGIAGGGTDDNVFLNLAPRALIEFNRAWTGYVRGRVFLPTGRVAPFDSSEPDNPNPARTFAGINEFWIQFNGLTSYPGEAVRLGRQHIRQTDSEWWDQDAEALRWIFDTTLLNADVGVAHSFSTYRTDAAEVPVAQRDRTYLFGHIAADWRAENTLGLRVAHAIGGGRPPQIGDPTVSDTQLQNARLTWVGIYADNGFYSILGVDKRLSYGLAINYLSGHQDIALRGAGETVTTRLSQDVSAWQASAGLRWRPLSRVPLQFGGGYNYSEGGESGGRSHQYQQTGMQSNTSYFTGTKTLIGRYNETLQPELGNLSVATGFVSLDFVANDASLIFAKFRKSTGRAPIVTGNVTVAPVNNDRDIGNGLDLVVTHYFDRVQRRRRLLDRGDAFTAPQRRSLISLRASFFQPGKAYGPEARTDYRMLVEATLWLD